MSETFRIWQIEDTVIELCNHQFNPKNSQFKYEITPLYLNLLMYYLSVISMLKNNGTKSLIPIDLFRRFDYGPNLYSINSSYTKHYGGNHIDTLLPHLKSTEFKKYDRKGSKQVNYYQEHYYYSKQHQLDTSTVDFLKATLPLLLKYSSFQLVAFSHQESQWQERKNRYDLYQPILTYLFYKQANHQFWNKQKK